MEIEFDPAKRDQVLAERGLDMARAGEIFEGFFLTRRDGKHSTDEERFISVGLLDDDVVIVPWTLRGILRRIVTMWKANDRERQNFKAARERSDRDQA
jgi:uncharacterized DUF497 family protein